MGTYMTDSADMSPTTGEEVWGPGISPTAGCMGTYIGYNVGLSPGPRGQRQGLPGRQEGGAGRARQPPASCLIGYLYFRDDDRPLATAATTHQTWGPLQSQPSPKPGT